MSLYYFYVWRINSRYKWDEFLYHYCLLSTSPFRSIKICFIYFGVPMWEMLIDIDDYFISQWIAYSSLQNVHLFYCYYYSLCLKSSFPDKGYTSFLFIFSSAACILSFHPFTVSLIQVLQTLVWLLPWLWPWLG